MTGHVTGCGGADPNNLLTSAPRHNQSFFLHKTKKMCHISNTCTCTCKAAALQPHSCGSACY